MKKIFLLTLISVFFLSAFSQNAPSSTPELITKINITKYMDDVDANAISNVPGTGWWRMFWKEVKVESIPGGLTITCIGRGWVLCMLRFSDWKELNGISPQIIHEAYETLLRESDQQMSRGGHQGSLSKKIAYLDSKTREQSYLLLQMTWDNNPEKPYNGKAEISIYKTNKLGI